MEKSKYYSIAQIAKILGLSRQAVYKRVKKGKIKAVRIGRSYAIPRDFVDKKVVDIQGHPLSKREKDIINKSVEKTVKEYGDVLKKLGRE